MWQESLPHLAEASIGNLAEGQEESCFLIELPHTLLCCATWQQLNVIPFVAGHTSREEDGIGLAILQDEPDDIFDL